MGVLTERIRNNDRAALPLLICFPFLNFPKVLDGDTQPWLLVGCILSISFFMTRFRRDYSLTVIGFLCLACVLIVCVRGADLTITLRYVYVYLMCFMLFLLLRDTSEEARSLAVRYAIVVWFLFGAVQYVFLVFGIAIEFTGRFVEGRTGVPSILAEPSFFGSLSALGAIHLLRVGGRKKEVPFILAAVANVVMSGSIISFGFLSLAAMFLPRRAILPAAAAAAALLWLDLNYGYAGITSRIYNIRGVSNLENLLLVDPSISLRLGHLTFTLWYALPEALVWSLPLKFQLLYNNYAVGSGYHMLTSSEFILPAAGDIVFSTGAAGALLLAFLIRLSLRAEPSSASRWRKAILIAVCLVNPIGLQSPFFMLLLLSAERATGAAAAPLNSLLTKSTDSDSKGLERDWSGI